MNAYRQAPVLSGPSTSSVPGARSEDFLEVKCTPGAWSKPCLPIPACSSTTIPMAQVNLRVSALFKMKLLSFHLSPQGTCEELEVANGEEE